ncbi:MAG: putative metal-binding motif-containing protein, partial [Bacteroidia bacterium]|nr:putative metal-binding motif-containing protein [Bacteroidia bacterium]
MSNGWQILDADITGDVTNLGSAVGGERIANSKITGRVLGDASNNNFIVENDSIYNHNGQMMMTLYRGRWIGNYIRQTVAGYYEVTNILSSSTPGNDSVYITGNRFEVESGGRTIGFWSNTQYVYIANNYLLTNSFTNAALYFRSLKQGGPGKNACINNTVAVGFGPGMFFQIGAAYTIEVRNNLLLNGHYALWNPGDVTFDPFQYNFTTNNSTPFVNFTADGTNTSSSNSSISSEGFLQAYSDAINGGDPNPVYNDANGSRNDAGAFGGNNPISNYFNYGLTDSTFYQDADADSYGNPLVSTMAYARPAGFVPDGSDCDDANPAINPGAYEQCTNNIDDDCNGLTDDNTGLEYEPVITYNGSLSLPSCATGNVVLEVGKILSKQYASSVVAFSSQYTSGSWSANQVLGAPNVYPNHQDDAAAWSPLGQDDQREYIEVEFSNPGLINFIDIYETYQNGSIDTVYIKNPYTQLFQPVFTQTAGTLAEEGHILHISFPLTPFPVSQVRIAMNSPAILDWNEIDAIAIGRIDTAAYDSYLWSGGQSSASLTVSTVGTYSVTVSKNGCSSTTGSVSTKLYEVFAGPSFNWISCPGTPVILA